MEIHGVKRLKGGTVDSENDHRIAMMLAIAATAADGEIILSGAESVQKSYPNFWSEYERLGERSQLWRLNFLFFWSSASGTGCSFYRDQSEQLI